MSKRFVLRSKILNASKGNHKQVLEQ